MVIIILNWVSNKKIGDWRFEFDRNWTRLTSSQYYLFPLLSDYYQNSFEKTSSIFNSVYFMIKSSYFNTRHITTKIALLCCLMLLSIIYLTFCFNTKSRWYVDNKLYSILLFLQVFPYTHNMIPKIDFIELRKCYYAIYYILLCICSMKLNLCMLDMTRSAMKV